MLRSLLVLVALLVLAMLLLIVPTASGWIFAGRTHNAAHLLSPEAALASTFLNTSEAYVMCRQFVRHRLQAQSTVKFPHLSDVTMFKQANYLTVIGYVDTHRESGAQIRTPYTCNVKPAAGDQWTLVSLYLAQ